MRVRQLTAMALMGTLMVVLQVARRFLPNIEPVSFLVILSALAFGWDTIWAVLVFVFAEGMIYGFMPSWWVGYLIIWPGLCALAIAFKKSLLANNMRRSLFSGAFGLCFGLLYAIGNIPFIGLYGAFGYWVAGLPFDALHMAGNYFIMLLLGNRALDLLMRQRRWIYAP
jgi:energy-coupling factor transport system substrate-specific component